MYGSDDEKNRGTETSMSNNTHTSTNSWFDPPIENYRFYYQGGGSTSLTNRNSAKGFVLKTRRGMRLDGDLGSEGGNKTQILSSSSRNLFGSTISRGGGAASVDRSDDRDSQNTSSY